ncbi:hypothetical protein V1509DRAFT_634657 [Lipomyces kononenkoae]
MSLPHVLTYLTEREAVADALYRSIIGFDSYDVSMFDSAWVPDIIFDLNGTVFNGPDAIRTHVLDLVGPMDTSHTVSNVRVDVKPGATTASLTAYALAQHCPPGKGTDPNGPKYLTSSRYFLDLVKDESDGLWKIKKFMMKVIWTQGDRSVMQRSS